MIRLLLTRISPKIRPITVAIKMDTKATQIVVHNPFPSDLAIARGVVATPVDSASASAPK